MIQVKILGTGCPKCHKLYNQAEKAIEMTGVQARLSKVTEMDQILDYGLIVTPALVIGTQLKTTGKVPGANQIAQWLKEEALQDRPGNG